MRKKISKRVDRLIMGAIIGAAVGSVVGAQVKSSKNATKDKISKIVDLNPPKKRNIFMRLLSALFGSKKK